MLTNGNNTSNKPAIVLAPSTDGDLKAQLARLEAENNRLRTELHAGKTRGEAKISVKVSEKGAISVYGLGRFPVTLYGAQWDRLAAEMPKIQAFAKEATEKALTRGKDEDVESFCKRLGKEVPVAKPKA